MNTTRTNTHCVGCGKYVRKDSPQRSIYVGYEDALLCRDCEQCFHGKEA